MDNQPNQYQDANQQPQVPVTETPTPTKQASLWSKFTGVFRRRKADEKLAQAGIVTSNPERYAGVDLSLQRKNPPQEDASKLYVDTSIEDVKTQVKRGLLEDEYKNTPTTTLKELLAVKKDKVLKLAYDANNPNAKDDIKYNDLEIQLLTAELNKRLGADFASKDVGTAPKSIDLPPVSGPVDVNRLTDAEVAEEETSMRKFAEGMSDDQVKEAIEALEAENKQALFKQTPPINITVGKFMNFRDTRISILKRILQERAASIATAKQAIKLAEPISTSSVQTEIPVINDLVREPELAPRIKKLDVKRIQERLKASTERLSGYACNTMDEYAKLPLKQKVKFGALMAGMGVLTGGLTTIASKTFAVSRAVRETYNKEVTKLTKGLREMTPEEKRTVTLKACAIGLVIGGVGMGVGTMLDIINDLSLDNPITNTVEAVKESVATSEVAPRPLFEEFSGPKSVMDVKDIDMSQVATPEVAPQLESYTVQAGDNLEKILKERVLGEFDLDDKQKLTKIYNLLSSLDGKKALAELGIDNVNKIAEGQDINLSKLKDLLK